MATFYGDNYKRAFIDRPNDKYKMGEDGGKGRWLVDSVVVSDALAIGDLIEIGVIPANSRLVSAQLHIDKSLGATGIVSLGHGATEDEEGNAIALANAGVSESADAGGQAALASNGAAQTLVAKRLGKETRIFVHCSEAVDGNVSDAVLTAFIQYVND